MFVRTMIKKYFINVDVRFIFAKIVLNIKVKLFIFVRYFFVNFVKTINKTSTK